MLKLAAILCVLIGIAHSYLGERYLLSRLFKRENLPKILGSDYFTKGTLRFCWHIMTFAVWGFGILIWLVAIDYQNLSQAILLTCSLVFLASALASFAFTKAKHLSWIFLLAISIICFYQA